MSASVGPVRSTGAGSALIAMYRALTSVAGPLILASRIRRGKEDSLRINERRGRSDRSRPPGPLLWIHAASVGEVVSALPLIDAATSVSRPPAVLVTSGTVTSAAIAAARLRPPAFHQYIPLDHPAWAAAFLDHWRPNLGLWVESELWPNLIGACRDRDIPICLVNARMSEASFRRWQRIPRTVSALLSAFVTCLAQDPEQATRLRSLGARDVRAAGNLKFAAAPLAADIERRTALAVAMSGRPVWLAASTHPGEEEVIARVHLDLARERPDLLTIIVPRHPDRGPEILALVARIGLRGALRSRGDLPTPDVRVYVADTIGELGTFFTLARIVFVGGSLVPHGGQNVLEPALLGCTVLTGPYTGNFTEVCRRLEEAGGLLRTGDESALRAAVARLLDDPDGASDRAETARAAATAAAEEGRVALETAASLVARLLAEPSDLGQPEPLARGSAGP
jgi:3-deoxy-D-manno-octulosonic-acid transferase